MTAKNPATKKLRRAAKPAEPKPRGRRPIAPEERMIVHPIRLKAAQVKKLQRIGGTPRLRKWIDTVKEKEAE